MEPHLERWGPGNENGHAWGNGHDNDAKGATYAEHVPLQATHVHAGAAQVRAGPSQASTLQLVFAL